MQLSAAQTFIDLLQHNNNAIHSQLKDITQAESLLQLPFRGNCMNWVMGHIVGVRDQYLQMLGLPGILTDAERKTYGYGSEPLTDPATASDLTSLVERLDQSLAILISQLEKLSAADFDREVKIWRGPLPLGEALSFFQWHEAYHTGQLEQLRQLAGKNDKVI